MKGFTELENAVLTVNSKSFKTYGDAMMGFADILWRGIENCHLVSSNFAGRYNTEQCKKSKGGSR